MRDPYRRRYAPPMDGRPPPLAVDILSDDDVAAFSPSPLRPKKRPSSGSGGGGAEPQVVIISDDPTPQKPNPAATPSFVPETPLFPDPFLASGPSMIRCTLARSDVDARRPPLSDEFSGITRIICLDSDNELEGGSCRGSMKKSGLKLTGSDLMDSSQIQSSFHTRGSPTGTVSVYDDVLCLPTHQEVSISNEVCETSNEHAVDQFFWNGTTDCMQITGRSPAHSKLSAKDIAKSSSYNVDEHGMMSKDGGNAKPKGKRQAVNADKNDCKNEEAARGKCTKEEKARLIEERKRKRQEEKRQKEALKVEAAELKKLEKEKQKWEKGKFAIKSIVAEIDAKVVENGSVGGHLLTRFAEKGLSFRITSNPIENSVVWKMTVPDQITQISSMPSEVPYILIVYQAEEFCNLVLSESFMDHVQKVRSLYPSFTVCYLTNKLMSYINKCEQSQYKNPLNRNCWRRPPVEEVMSKLTTDFNGVHSRQCIDEAELAEHVVGLTSSLASCQFRKKLTWLSVNANGSIIPKDFVYRNLIRKHVWLKALIVIPKVQPRFAIAIWKKYPTMRSLLNVYMDPNKTVHEKEFLLKDLTVEGLLGDENRRLGEMCSKRVYRILMAQSGLIKTDDVEDGADLFGC